MAVAVCAMTLGACSDDNDWQPGPAAEGEGLYFASDQQANITVTETSGTFTIDVYRSKAEGAITAQIATVTGDNATSLFTVPAEVSFAEGETKTALTVTYTGLERDVNYNLTLSVADSTPYGIAELGLTVICPLVWDVVSTNATLIDNLFEPFGAAGVELTGITVEKHPEQNRYRFRSPYDNEYFQGLFEMDVFERRQICLICFYGWGAVGGSCSGGKFLWRDLQLPFEWKAGKIHPYFRCVRRILQNPDAVRSGSL